MTLQLDRREFLRFGAGLAGLSTAGAFGLQLAAAGSAAGATASDYKALVCIFLYGGNDSNNMVIATDGDSWGRYFSARSEGGDPIALMPIGTEALPAGVVSPLTGRVTELGKPEALGGVLPITLRTPQPVPLGTVAANRTFAFHPSMASAKTLFDSGRLAILANVGTLIEPTTKTQYLANSVKLPPSLFSHNDQQSTWQAGATEGARLGWGGKMGDLLANQNGQNTIFTAITTSGAAVFLSGQSIVQYPLSTGSEPAVRIVAATSDSFFGSKAAPSALKAILTDTTSASDFANDHAAITSRSVGAAGIINAAFSQPIVMNVASPPSYTNPATGTVEVNNISMQMRTVARMVAAGPSFGLKRQIFIVNGGGWDSHDNQSGDHANNLGKLSQALSYFDEVLANINGVDMRSNVTTFTASDFSRTLNTNGDGTDHGWGGHHLIMGGAVKGGRIFGQFPTIGLDINGFSNPDLVGGSFIPTTSVDQYAATLGRWFGVDSSDLNTIFPNLRNFGDGNLGFL